MGEKGVSLRGAAWASAAGVEPDAGGATACFRLCSSVRGASRWDAFRPPRLDADGGMDGLGQAVQHIRPQRTRAFEEITESLRRNAGLHGNLADEPSAAMNGSSQMTAERLFAFRFHHPVVPFAEFPHLFGDKGAFPPELFQESR